MLSAACALALLATACSDSTVKQGEKMIDKYIEKVQSAPTLIDVASVYSELQDEVEAFDERHPDRSESENDALARKMGEFETAFYARVSALVGDGALEEPAEPVTEEPAEAADMAVPEDPDEPK